MTRFLLAVPCALLCGGLLSCGLDTSYYVEAPQLAGPMSYYDTASPEQQYFSFITNESGENGTYVGGSSEFTFLGTELYYKIYTNISTMQNVESAVSSRSTATQAEALINSYGYKTIRLADTSTPSPLITATGRNRYVYIRLADMDPDSDGNYTHTINISTSPMTKSTDGTPLGKPRRNVNASYGFHFGRTSTQNPVPAGGDSDFSGTTTSDGPWYVDMYAVSVGKDTSSNSTSYSGVLFLGQVKIQKYSD